MQTIHTYEMFKQVQTEGAWLRNMVRDFAVWGLSLGRSIERTTDWVRFPYYHHVFDDERVGFAQQLDYLQRFGDFISIDDIIALLASGDKISGRYFCISFDDGFKNNLTNALPILLDKKVPATFFVTTGYIGSDLERDYKKILGFYDNRQTLMEFMNWNDCRELVANDMNIGSHTINHFSLAALGEVEVRKELKESKEKIEAEVGRSCDHFCSPFGIPGRDFIVDRDPGLVKAAGYKSLLTTERGATRRGNSPYHIRRDHTLANWGTSQLRYFLSL